MIPHFFKARSRIGISYLPYKQKSSNKGVEFGADEILSKDFLTNFKNSTVSSFDFSSPENFKVNELIGQIANETKRFKNTINSNLKKNEIQVVIGGDHSISLGSTMAQLERIQNPQMLGYVHLDSHGDINLFKESPTGNFHGMYLRPLFDNFDFVPMDSLVSNKIPTQNLLMIGNLDLDKGERKFIRDKKINTISRKDFLKNKSVIINNFEAFVEKFKYLHISIDVDVLDKSIFPSTGIPANQGFFMEDLRAFLKVLKKCNFSLDISEFNPEKKGTNKSAKLVEEILLFLLS